MGRGPLAFASTRRAVAIVALLCAASSARAQPSGPEEQRRTALYKEGFDAATAGRWAEAKERFSAALAIRASAKVYFSLAQAEEQLGQLASASRAYEHAVEDGRAAGENDVVSAASSALALLDPRVPRVRIVVEGSAGAAATLDGQAVTVNTPVAVDPGAHRIVVSAPGMQEAQATVAAGERQHLDVPVHLERAAPASVQASTTSPQQIESPSERAPFPWRTLAVATAGVGIVTLGVGPYFGLQAKSKNDQSNSSGCNASNDACTPSAAAVRRDAIVAGNTSTVLFVAGGVLAASGVALWLLAPAPHADTAALNAGPVILAGGAGLALKTAW